MMKVYIWISILLCVPVVARAGGIRTVQVNDKKMQRIYLKMGRATVLRFTSKPKKVVIGNQNYYAVEFIDNDLTIQPQVGWRRISLSILPTEPMGLIYESVAIVVLMIWCLSNGSRTIAGISQK